MRIAVNITHPAHVHFFKNAIAVWQNQGNNVLILSRDKDVTVRLLNELGLQHNCLTKVQNGVAGLIIETIQHSLGAWKAMKQHKTDIATAIAGPYISPAAKTLGIPSLVFSDTEVATLSNYLAFPFATKIYTPESYPDDLGKNHTRYRGFHETAYLHPNWFIPDGSKLNLAGLAPSEPFSFVRMVAWGSNHDIGKKSLLQSEELIDILLQHGKVLISSEASIPTEYEKYRYTGPANQIHHILAHAQLFVGESATMASEAVHLGVPAVLVSPIEFSVTRGLAQQYKMLFYYSGDVDPAVVNVKVNNLLKDPDTKSIMKTRHNNMLADLTDVTSFIVDQINAYS